MTYFNKDVKNLNKNKRFYKQRTIKKTFRYLDYCQNIIAQTDWHYLSSFFAKFQDLEKNALWGQFSRSFDLPHFGCLLGRTGKGFSFIFIPGLVLMMF